MNPFLRWIAPVAAQVVLGCVCASANVRAQQAAMPPAYRLDDAKIDQRLETRHLRAPMVRADSSKHPSRRAVITGGVVGAMLGGLGAAGYILNATAYDCVTSGAPCRHRNYTFLNTVTIATGAAVGGFLGANVGGWFRK